VRKKKVLFLSATNGIGGAGIAVTRIANALEGQGVEVDIESLNYSSSKKSLVFRKVLARANRGYEKLISRNQIQGSNVTQSANRLPFRPIRGINYAQYDVVHIHWVNYGVLGLNHLKKIPKGIPIVWTLHSFWPFSSPGHYFTAENPVHDVSLTFTNNKNGKALKRVNKWLLPSKAMVGQLPGLLNYSVVNNPLPNQESQAIRLTNSRDYLFIAAGDIFDDRKGLKDLLELWISHKNLFGGDRLIVIGPQFPNTSSKVLVKKAEESGVLFLGEATSAREVQTMLRLCKAVFVPSYQETFGQVISEALGEGCLVIARESILSLGEFDKFFANIRRIDFSSDSFISAILWVQKKNINREKIARDTQMFFSQDRIAMELIAIYDQL
jgi:glycosyltransferase involved in cell wall biosynthesis